MKSFKYYESDCGRTVRERAPGSYIAYRNTSGDESCIGPIEDVIDDDKHALELLKQYHPGDWEGGRYYARVSHYGRVDIKTQETNS